MPLFEYEALSESGKKVSSTIDADHLDDAKLKLVKRQIVVLKIRSLN